MSRIISDILRAPEPAFSHIIADWERLAGRPSVDVKLTSELRRVVREIIRDLGLDARDTTPEELYYALTRRALDDNQRLAEHIGIKEADTPRILVKKIITFIEKLAVEREVWAVKNSVVKQLLKAHPPKKLMKISGFRSIDSVLKRQSTSELLALAALVEPADWVQKFHNRYKKLTSSDFDSRTSEVCIADSAQIEKLRSAEYLKHQLVLPQYELGSILVAPPAQRFAGDVLVFTTAILESLRACRIYSAYFRAMSVWPKFGENIVEALSQGLAQASKSQLNSGWPALHALPLEAAERLLAGLQPHLQPSDLHAPNSATVLAEVLPSFRFWVQRHYVCHPTKNGAVSCHLFDVAVNASNGLPYEQRVSAYGQGSLWNELSVRYLFHEPVARQTLKWYDGLT
jgi:hypothetical protein